MEAFILTKDGQAFRDFLGNTPFYTRKLNEAKLFSSKKAAERFQDFFELKLSIERVRVG